ncbi:MAG: universal stress protein [Actinobacteria bacterium]|nr:universal stress protein [Actinomycetota bacterium]MBU1492719.1 universal stress protein [Actinomycetota bacterium]MBU1864989.1 universal stress protein [Actinomycetota bacterium]
MAWNPKVVVVGIDGSERSIHAAQTAADLARKNESKLYIVTVVRPPEGWWGIVGSPPPADVLTASMSQAQQGILDDTVAQIALDGVEWEVAEEIGEPATALADVCRDKEADLLVVGRRGAGLVERLVMGSVADRVAHYAPCPVLIVP